MCIETATTNCSVALSIDGKIAVLKEDNGQKYSHAERLHMYIAEVLAQANIKNTDLDAIAISKGPGSYTGLRIGVSAAKGLCFALNLPLIATETLKLLGSKVKAPLSEFVIPMLDARRMEVYSAIFTAAGEKVRETQAQILDAASFQPYLEKNIVHFIGNGVVKFEAVCEHTNARYIEDQLPSAREMCLEAHKRFKLQQYEDVAYFEPYYLKDFIAGKPKGSN